MIPDKKKRIIVYRALRKVGLRRERINTTARFTEDFKFDTFEWCVFLNQLEDLAKIKIEDSLIKQSITIEDVIKRL